MDVFIEIIGWLGSFLVLSAYGFTIGGKSMNKYLSMGKYMNLAGGVFLAINCLYNDALPPFFANVVWTTIAIIILIRSSKKKSTSDSQDGTVSIIENYDAFEETKKES